MQRALSYLGLFFCMLGNYFVQKKFLKNLEIRKYVCIFAFEFSGINSL